MTRHWFGIITLLFSLTALHGATRAAPTEPSDATWRPCLSRTGEEPQALRQLSRSLETLENSRIFGAYFRDLIRSERVSICLDTLSIDARGYYEPETRRLAVAARLPRADMSLILAHELRHLDQYRRGYGLSLAYGVTANVLRTYAVEADAQAFTSYFAWNAAADGDRELWRAALRLKHYEDIAATFGNRIEAGAGPDAAMRAAFAAWYHSSWRRGKYYLFAAGNYLDQRDALHAIPRYVPLPAGYFDRLCLMPDGHDYGCRTTFELNPDPSALIHAEP